MKMSDEIDNTHHHPDTDGTAKHVADAFLNQYYDVLRNHPELVHKFYVDTSVISRPASDGSVSSATTLKGIDGLIQSLYAEGESYVDICVAEAQYSYGDGICILVTGLIGSKDVKKRFSQMFFLAPQERGYYVLNDMFQFSSDDVSASEVVDKELVTAVADESELTVVKAKAENGKKETEPAVVDKEAIKEPNLSKAENVAVKSKSANGLANGKSSYASVIKAPPSSTPASQPPHAAHKPIVKAPQSPPIVVATAPSSTNAAFQSNDKKLSPTSKGNDLKDDERSVSVWELPLAIKPHQIDRSFSKKFGPIKQGGIQIRNTQGKNGPICYAFIEFETPSSAEAAIKASPVSIDGRPVIVKRKTNKGKYNGKPRNGSPRRDNAHGRHRDASFDRNNAGQRSENGYNNGKSNGHMNYEHVKVVTPVAPTKPEIDEDGFQTVSRNGMTASATSRHVSIR